MNGAETPAAARNPGRRWAVAVLLLPALAYLAVLPFAGHLQYNDYYGILGSLMDGGHLSHDPVRWLMVKSNEHSVALSALLYAVNLLLTGGDNLGLSVFSLAMMVISALILWSMVPQDLKNRGRSTLGLAAVVGLFALTPVAVHNIVMGFSGTLWLTANALALGALWSAWRGAASGRGRHFVQAAVLGLAAALAYSTGIAVWPALLVLVLVLRVPWRRAAILLGPAILDLAFEAATYTRPAELPPPETARPILLLRFLAVYLGQVFARPRVAAGLLGLACLAAAVLVPAWVRRTKGPWRELAPWLAVGVYGLTNAMITTVARARVGGARSSRYATLACFVWLAVFMAAAWAVEHAPSRRRRSGLALVLATLASAGAVAMGLRGAGLFADYLDRAALQPVARIAWIHGVDDPEMLRSVSVAPQQLAIVRGWMTALRHIPFERPVDIRPGEPLSGTVQGGCGTAVVTLRPWAEVGGGILRVRGVVQGGPRHGGRLALLDGEGRVRGLGARLRRPPVTRLRWPERGVPWAGYLEPGSGPPVQAALEISPGRWCLAPTVRWAGNGPSSATQEPLEEAVQPPRP